MELDWIRTCVTEQRYAYSIHADRERQADALTLDEVEEALLNGILLETYEDTGRGESCLVAGFTHEGKPVHVVAGTRQKALVIITVYIPTPPKFLPVSAEPNLNPWTALTLHLAPFAAIRNSSS